VSVIGWLRGNPDKGAGGNGECTASTAAGLTPDVHKRTRRHHCMRDKGHGRPGAEDRSKTHRCTCGYEWR
jgi:hypothetical protein